MASIDDYIKMYERINQQFISIISPCIDSLSSETMGALNTLNRMAYSPIQEWGESCAHTFTPFQEIFDNLINSSAVSIAAAFRDPTILATSFQRILSLDTLQNFENLIALPVHQLGISFNPLFSAIDNIHILSDYVEVPEELIPEKLFPEAALSENVSGNAPTKKLSKDQALAIISILLTILFWILNNTSPASWQQKHHDEISQSLENQNNLLEESNQIQKRLSNLLEESNQIQVERTQLEREQLDATKEQTQATKEQTQVLKAIAHLLGIQDSLLSPEAAAPSESPDTDLKETNVDPGSPAAQTKAANVEVESFPADEPHPIPD